VSDTSGSNPPPSGAPVIRPGDIIAGKYRVEVVLGRGGMGVVVAATHVELEQRVALKFLLPDAAAHPEFVARFAREAKAAAKIKSEHGVKILDVGTLPTGLPYMVMEYLDGEDLKQLLKRTGPIAIDAATGFLLQASEALAEAHLLGIVHRDLKPANLFLTRYPNGDPLIKVLDFGISKSAPSPNELQLTGDAMMLGSPNYVSPEQLTSAKTVDARSDIWSLGVVLYELLTGVKPFQAGSAAKFIATILYNPHKPIREVRKDVPEGLAEIVDRCLAKDPQRRFQNVAELARSLAPFGPPRSELSVWNIMKAFGATTSGGSRPPPAAPGAPSGLATTSTERSDPTVGVPIADKPKTERKRKGGGAVGGILVVLLMGGTGVMLWWLRTAPPRVNVASPPPVEPAVSSAPSESPAAPPPTPSAAPSSSAAAPQPEAQDAATAPATSAAAAASAEPAPSATPAQSAAPAASSPATPASAAPPPPAPPAPSSPPAASAPPAAPAPSGRKHIPATLPQTTLRPAGK
jgi:serine/threonine-protein kinase